MIGNLNHVAIAVPDLDAASARYRNAFGDTVSAPVENIEQGVRVVFVELSNSKIELLHPIDETSPIAAFLQRNPSGGMHHVCFEVDDIIAAREKLIGDGARVIGSGEPAMGVHGKRILFLHPKDFSGTLIELEET